MGRQIGFDLLRSGMRLFCKSVPPGVNSVLIVLGQIQLIEQALWFVHLVYMKLQCKSRRGCGLGKR